jgi:hypothetical protein
MRLIQNPLRLIAVVLVALAAISGYGLYQTMVNWAYAQQTIVNMESQITDDVQLTFGEGGHAFLTVNFRMFNEDSRLDVQVYEISYYAYASDEEIMPQSAFIGLGGRSFVDTSGPGLVAAGDIANIEASLPIQNGTMYWDILQASADGDSYPIQIGAVIRFEVADYPNIEGKLYPAWIGDVVAG